MSEPLSMNDASVYSLSRGFYGSPPFIGVFIQNGKPLPVQFNGASENDVWLNMKAWLLAEREKLAKRESHLAYLRSEEAIAARKVAREARKAAKLETTP